ncbi:hypothetical protein GOBAR_AA26615 [Gossypium barbadense]|uniref:Ataxin 2 SM domain-containing protein n=1 Tax=Gossypium barbadense TaxID=3634 RepID=A0A2P5WSI2_GOSBA|nr:hypothetical protein GOBAR_AA26615 [Gossypium barbadense]
MELKNRVEEENCLMNEALLLATMYILGLPVDMHLTDGSVYSGIFHTAAVEKEFGGHGIRHLIKRHYCWRDRIKGDTII